MRDMALVHMNGHARGAHAPPLGIWKCAACDSKRKARKQPALKPGTLRSSYFRNADEGAKAACVEAPELSTLQFSHNWP
jgi:hypothetical protein